jgi:glycosyltransferase involved in cell wall biosynthesis
VNKLTVSVIVPFYNSGKYIERCVEALLDQTIPKERYEIILVNNNSTDSSADILRRFPYIKLIAERQRGSYSARNSGLKKARGEIIAFTDSDCVPAANWLREIESSMVNPDVGIVIGSCQFAGESILLSMLEDYENEKNKYVLTSGINKLYYGHTRNMAVRKRLFDELGPFLDRARGSDTIFIQRCIDRYSCNIVLYSPLLQVRHMEIDSPDKYWRKLFVYGKSSSKYSQVVNARPLTNRERYRVFRSASSSRGYSWFRTIAFMCLLIIGYFFWISGTLTNTLISGTRENK